MSASILRKLKQVQECLQNGDVTAALSLCQQILLRTPGNPDALCMLGMAHLAAGRAADAVPPFERALSVDARNGLALEHLGLAHMMLGQFAHAEYVLRRAAALSGAPASVFMRLGASLIHQNRPADALAVLQRAITLAPEDIESHLNLGQALAQTGEAESAEKHFATVLRLAPDNVDAMFNIGVLRMSGDDPDGAGAWFERVLAQSPTHADAQVNLGIVLQRRSLFKQAAARLRQALALEPANVAAANELAHTLALQGSLADAREQYRATLRMDPRHTLALEGLGSVCLAMGRVDEAVGHLQSLLQAEPDNSNALSLLTSALFEGGQLDDAAAVAQRLCTVDPAAPGGYATLANIHMVRGELDRVIAVLETGYAQSGSSTLLGMLTYQLRQACDWHKWQVAWDSMVPQLAESAALGSPFWLLCEPISAVQQLDYARRWAQARFRQTPLATHTAGAALITVASAVPQPRQRLRVGYLSCDFQEHAAAYLVAEVLELHDRERFEVFIYSHGPDVQSAMRERVHAAGEHFVDIAWDPDDVALARIAADELDILIDLKGYTAGNRLGLMAQRPCKVQVTWLGYPGTTGAAFMDYLIADAFIIPPGDESAYSERIVRMPHCYQPNDRKRVIADALPRADYGLPERAFVFCCFNQAYKITPEVFAVWMRLLHAQADSVLWLVESDSLAKHNLVEAARAQGVDAARLVFAPRVPYAQHLARYRVADLALDTFPYTSHTILSDALWCGCPAVGLCGSTFAARVSGSILSAAGLADLVTDTLSAYERLAAQLAAQPEVLREVRNRVAQARGNSALFDSTAFTRSLEAIYTHLASRL